MPLGQETDAVGEPGQISHQLEDTMTEEQSAEEEAAADDSREQNAVSDDRAEYQTKDTKEMTPRVKQLTPNTVIRKISVGDHLVSCCLDYFGESGPECFTQGQIIYINRDHPPYKRESKKKITHTMYLARLLSQEIALMKSPPDPRAALFRGRVSCSGMRFRSKQGDRSADKGPLLFTFRVLSLFMNLRDESE